MEEGLAKEGAAVFTEYCVGCHYADQTDTKLGPGFKGLFGWDRLPVSGRPVTDENIRKQLKAPVGAMPAFGNLSEEQVMGLLAFLKGL